MPVTVRVTSSEAEAITQAQVGELKGSAFTYDPRETVAICTALEETGHEGANRAVTRLADVYGKNFAQAKPPSPTRRRRVRGVDTAPAPPTMDEPAIVQSETGDPE